MWGCPSIPLTPYPKKATSKSRGGHYSQLAGDNDDPSWSSEGQELVFVNDRTGDYAVHDLATRTGILRTLDTPPRGSDDLAPFIAQY